MCVRNWHSALRPYWARLDPMRVRDIAYMEGIVILAGPRAGGRACQDRLKEAPMSDVPVFLLANLVVKDTAEYRPYEKGFFPLLKRYGGEFVTYDDAPHTSEGAAPRPGPVIMSKFPSQDQARRWYVDPGYQALSEHRHAGTCHEFLTMVRGMAPRA
jgi:uncharacterized protein (DUF1330 family)